MVNSAIDVITKYITSLFYAVVGGHCHIFCYPSFGIAMRYKLYFVPYLVDLHCIFHIRSVCLWMTRNSSPIYFLAHCIIVLVHVEWKTFVQTNCVGLLVHYTCDNVVVCIEILSIQRKKLN